LVGSDPRVKRGARAKEAKKKKGKKKRKEALTYKPIAGV
jgi:hypothetical protein